MIWFFIGLTISFCLVIFFIGRICWHLASEVVHYKKQAAHAATRRHSVDLELATTSQIITELRNRPNMHFLFIVPEDRGGNKMSVKTHACNISPNLVLTALQVATEGVREMLEMGDDDDDEDWPILD